jgi:hypothetical protein
MLSPCLVRSGPGCCCPALCRQTYKNDAVLSLHVSFVHEETLWFVMPFMEV